MKEIGGYFGLEQGNGEKEYYQDFVALNLARNALVYICKARQIRKLYLPFFICDTIPQVCDREKIAYEYYHISDDFFPIFDKELHNDEYLYVINYYGQLSNDNILDLKNKYHNIIVDNVQAFFQKPLEGVDTIYSCRKFFGVADGAYLYTDVKIDNIPIDNSDNRMSFLMGRIQDGASAHYDEFKNNEKSFYDLPLMKMSEKTHSLLLTIDYESVRKKRNENFYYLLRALSPINKLTVKPNDGPYTYPLLIDNGETIRSELIKNKIYIAKLWPTILEDHEKFLADNIIPLPCDQRYGKEEMLYIVKELEKCMKI